MGRRYDRWLAPFAMQAHLLLLEGQRANLFFTSSFLYYVHNLRHIKFQSNLFLLLKSKPPKNKKILTEVQMCISKCTLQNLKYDDSRSNNSQKIDTNQTGCTKLTCLTWNAMSIPFPDGSLTKSDLLRVLRYICKHHPKLSFCRRDKKLLFMYVDGGACT